MLSSMQNVVIREAREGDVGRIQELYREAEIDTEQSFTPEEGVIQLASFKKYPSLRVFVAEVDASVVGTYSLLIMDNLAKRGRKSAIVEDVAVLETYRGQGVGRAMMQHAMQLTRDAGCYKLVLSSNLKREDAHAFYESLGFERHGYSFRVSLD